MSGPKAGWSAHAPIVPLVSLFIGVDAVVATAALHAAIARPLGGWAYVYGCAAPVAAVAAMVWVGRRRGPMWTFPAAMASLVVNGALLEVSEWTAVVLLPLFVVALRALRRLPAHVPPAPVFTGGTVASASAATDALPAPDSGRVAESGVVTISLISRTRSIALLALSLAIGIVGALALRAGIASTELIVEGGPAGRILAGVFGSFFLLLGLFGLYGMTRIVMLGARLEVDARALRARGSVEFDLAWEDVERIGMRVRIRHVPGRAVMSRKRDVWIAVEPVAAASFLDRDDIPWLRPRGPGSPAPETFCAELTLVDPYYKEPSPTVVALDDALRRMVPGKYVGIIRD